MNGYVRAYEGSEPYIFVSYAHKDGEKVLPVLRQLYERKYRVWYDEGINPGSEWPDNIARHLMAASAVFLFVSRNFLDSENCRNEVKHAPAHMETYVISVDGGTLQSLMAYAKTAGVDESLIERMRKAAVYDLDDALIAKLESVIGREFIGDGINGYQYAIEKKRHFNAWNMMLGLAGALVVAFSIALYGLYGGWFDDLLPARQPPDTEVAAPTAPPQEGVSIDDTVIGSVLPVAFSSAEEKEAVYQKLGWTQPDEMTYMDLMGMEGLTHLEIWDDPIYDLSFAAYLPDLEVITVQHGRITDLTPLGKCPKLKTVEVTADMLPIELPEGRLFEVEII